MRARGSLIVFLALTSSVSAGCRESAEQRREAARATSEAELAASETTLTSATIEGPATGETAADDEALRERAEAIVALRRAQQAYRAKLQRALDDLDAKRREAKDRGAAYVDAIDGRRAVLDQHLRALERTSDQEWAALKAKIDRDLREHADEPQPQPQSETR